MYEEELKSVMEILSKLESRGFNSYTIFSDWLDLMLYALMGNDPEYMKIVERYRDQRSEGERNIDLFCHAFAELQLAMQKSNQEMLGSIYEKLSIANKQFAQFFTPPHMCELMAQISMGASDRENETVCDPCVGSGRMLIAALKTRKNPICFGQDKDLLCVKMTALNMCFFNADSQIVWGDSLKGECLKAYETRNSPLGGSVFEIDPETVEWAKFKEVKEVIRDQSQQTLLDLF